MNSLKGILFDFNGTLFFDSRIVFLAFHRAFEAFGVPDLPDGELTRSVIGKPIEVFYRQQIDPAATDADICRFADFVDETYRRTCVEIGQTCLVDGAEDLLNYLQEHGIPYCLATGSRAESVDFYLKTLGIRRWFDPARNIVFNDGIIPGKPEPDIYRFAAEKIGLTPAECLIFEDGTSGLLAARRAGAGGLIANYEQGLPSPFSNGLTADRTVHDLTGWRTILSHYGLLR